MLISTLLVMLLVALDDTATVVDSIALDALILGSFYWTLSSTYLPNDAYA